MLKLEYCCPKIKSVQKSKFWSKIENLVKNRKFGQKSKIWSKIETLVKNRKFGQKSKIWSKKCLGVRGLPKLHKKVEVIRY